MSTPTSSPRNSLTRWGKTTIKHIGGCHCGRVRFEVLAGTNVTVSICNCSVCYKSGFRGLIVPKEQFTLLSGAESLTTYTFNTGAAKHTFCTHCGIKSFYHPRSHPDGVSVNLSCVDNGTLQSVTFRPFNGQEWEKQYPAGQAERYLD